MTRIAVDLQSLQMDFGVLEVVHRLAQMRAVAVELVVVGLVVDRMLEAAVHMQEVVVHT